MLDPFENFILLENLPEIFFGYLAFAVAVLTALVWLQRRVGGPIRKTKKIRAKLHRFPFYLNRELYTPLSEIDSNKLDSDPADILTCLELCNRQTVTKKFADFVRDHQFILVDGRQLIYAFLTLIIIWLIVSVLPLWWFSSLIVNKLEMADAQLLKFEIVMGTLGASLTALFFACCVQIIFILMRHDQASDHFDNLVDEYGLVELNNEKTKIVGLK